MNSNRPLPKFKPSFDVQAKADEISHQLKAEGDALAYDASDAVLKILLPQMEEEFIAWCKKLSAKNNRLKALFDRAEFHNVQPKIVFKAILTGFEIVDIPFVLKNLALVVTTNDGISIAYKPSLDSLECPYAIGLSNAVIADRFLNDPIGFNLKSLEKSEWSDIVDAIVDYYCAYRSKNAVKLMYNPKKKKFVAGISGGITLFESVERAQRFFYGNEDPNECEYIGDLARERKQELLSKVGRK